MLLTCPVFITPSFGIKWLKKPMLKKGTQVGQVDCAASARDDITPHLFERHDKSGPLRASGEAKAKQQHCYAKRCRNRRSVHRSPLLVRLFRPRPWAGEAHSERQAILVLVPVECAEAD